MLLPCERICGKTGPVGLMSGGLILEAAAGPEDGDGAEVSKAAMDGRVTTVPGLAGSIGLNPEYSAWSGRECGWCLVKSSEGRLQETDARCGDGLAGA